MSEFQKHHLHKHTHVTSCEEEKGHLYTGSTWNDDYAMINDPLVNECINGVSRTR